MTTGHLSSRHPGVVSGGRVIGGCVGGRTSAGDPTMPAAPHHRRTRDAARWSCAGDDPLPCDVAAHCSRFCGWPALLGAHARLSAGVARRTPPRGGVGVLRAMPIVCVLISGSVGSLKRCALWSASYRWGGGWCWCGASAYATLSMAVCARGTPSSTCARGTPSSTWGGNRIVGGMLPRMNFGADGWGESSIMTGVHQRRCSSTLHIGWGLCDRVCLVLVCRGKYGLGVVVLLFILGSNLGGVGQYPSPQR